MALHAGDLRERVVIQQATTTQDAAGQPLKTWATLATLPAKVEQVRGGEMIRGRQVASESTTLVTVRWRADITVQQRVSWNGRTLGIVAVGDPYGERKELRIECREAA